MVAIAPFWTDGKRTIYHGDCREILPTLGKFDLLLTDPPYGMSYVSNWRKQKHEAISGDDSLPVGDLIAAMQQVNNASYVFCRWDNLAALPKPKSVIAWVKNNWTSGDLEHEHGRQWEACAFYPHEGHKFHKRLPDVIHFDKTQNNVHPTEKPAGLLRVLIGANHGHTIVDPYMGSGSTLVAAKLEGRIAVGIELSEKYCEAAVKRLQQNTLDFIGA